MTEHFTSGDYLREQQYKTAANLAARIRLHELFSTSTYDVHRQAFDLLLATTGTQGQVLEVGAGRGDLWAKNAERLPPGWRVTLTDFSAGMLDDARALLGAAAARFAWQTADVQALPFDDHTFDTVIANFMLYHVPDRPQAIRELRRVLKPGGTLHALSLGHEHMRDLYDALEPLDAPLAAVFKHASAAFRLQNGTEQLAAAFGDVQMIRFEGDLKVTELVPLLDYLRSTVRYGAQEQDALLAPLAAHFADRLAADGHIFIRKETGIFIARGYAAS
ncbi:MAG: class I SAM-dependent methyltransferase [Anaerolineae bacterium]|jgi:ubiquinone/menaquinone biosynthesis C-methylase UbiE|nr:class I SAM-dependent methyltransferase [Anaerolineae bacterium]